MRSRQNDSVCYVYGAVPPFYEKNSAKKVLVSGICWEQKNALQTCLTYLNRGLTVIVDLDILKFFDNVDHSLLLAMLEQEIKDPMSAYSDKTISDNQGCTRTSCLRKILRSSHRVPLSALFLLIFFWTHLTNF